MTAFTSNRSLGPVFAGDPGCSLIHMLARLGTQERLAAGEYLWHEGDRGDAVVLLREGSLEVVSAHPASQDAMVLRTLGPDTVLGELSCLDGGPRSASIRAADSALVARYPAADFRGLLHRHPHILEQLLLQQVDTVRHLTAQVAQSHRRAITDQLTQLYNLGFFVERLALELDRAAHSGDGVAVVMFDIDHFKRFNDEYGHQAGNDALQQVARILKAEGRRSDIVARFGGEELVALLYGASRDEAGAFAERVRRAVESADLEDSRHRALGRITLSGGVARFPDDARDVNALIRAADANLYRAKRDGRNRVALAGAG